MQHAAMEMQQTGNKIQCFGLNITLYKDVYCWSISLFFFILVGLLSPSLLTSYNFIICLKYYIGDDLHVIG